MELQKRASCATLAHGFFPAHVIDELLVIAVEDKETLVSAATPVQVSCMLRVNLRVFSL